MLIKNIKLFIKNDPFLACVFMITQVLAVVIIMLGYGIFMDINYELNNQLDESKTYYFESKSKSGLSFVHAKEIKEAFPEFFEEYSQQIDTITIWGTAILNKGRKSVRNDFSLVNNNDKLEYGLGKIDLEAMMPFVLGEWFTAEDYNNATREIIIPYSMRAISEEFQIINDEEFQVRAFEEKEPPEKAPYIGMDNTIVMPLEVMPDELNIDSVIISFKNPISLQVYNELCDKFGILYAGNLKKPEYVKIDIKNTDSLKTMQLSSIGIALIAAVTVCLIVRYIMVKRNKMSAIYRIMGQTELKLILCYFFEILINLLISIALGMMLFLGIIKKLLLKNYQWFNVIFEDNGYLKFIEIYAGILIFTSLIVVIISCRKNPYQLLISIEK